MLKRILFIIIALSFSFLCFSQEADPDSIVPQKTRALPSTPVDSTFVTINSIHFDSIFLKSSRVIDTTTFHAPVFEILEKEHLIYSTLSNTGLAHKPMRFRDYKTHGFDMSLPAYMAYIQNERNMVSHQSVLPYSEVRYVMTSGDKEQHLNFRFGRQFLPRLFLSFAINSELSPGSFKNNRSINNYVWINAHYVTKSQRYAVMAYFYRNKLEMQENGGIVNDENYTSHAETDNSVITTNLSNATTFVKSSGFGLEHYFNLLSQTKKSQVDPPLSVPVNESLIIDSLRTDTLSLEPAFSSADSITDSIAESITDSISDRITDSITDRIADSITENITDSITESIADSIKDIRPVKYENKVRKFTLGRLCHEFNFQRNSLYYNENSPSVAFYRPYDTLLNTSKTTDTTIVQAIRNTLKWSSLGYQQYNDDIPFYLYAGLTHGFYRVKHYDYVDDTVIGRNMQQLSVNGGVIVNLFHSTRITGQANLVTLGYHIGDFDIKGHWRQFIGTTSRNFGNLDFVADIKRQSASWFEEQYYSNHFRWENEFKASTLLAFDLKYTFREYSIGIKQTSIAQYIYFGTDARPTQYDGMFSIREAYLSFRQDLWRFNFEGFASLQKASNEDVIHLPLLQARLRIAYSQPIFRKAATLQPMLTVTYFTKYYADAYMPATRTFYLQNDVEIGNYPFIDLAIALKVKKANIFVSYSNMFLLTGMRDAFIAPHYPMRGSKFFFGVNWRLFN